MKYHIFETQNKNQKVAGLKARDDVAEVLDQEGYERMPIEMNLEDITFKNTVYIYKKWMKELKGLNSGDEVVFQLPLIYHTILIYKIIDQLKKRGIKVYGLIHDIESLRWGKRKDIPLKRRIRIKLEEKMVFARLDSMIVHNQCMIDYLYKNGFADKDKLIDLKIFDYLLEKENTIRPEKNMPVIIAGNLKPHKVGYIKKLPEDVEFNLYGIGYEDDGRKNIHYHGSYMPNELPYCMRGSYGLIWDGPEADCCVDVYGEYLKYNNPHKTSLYLASGIPVIIWKKAALAPFIENNELGIVVDSLYDIKNTADKISDEQYEKMVQNVQMMSNKLRCGDYVRAALEQLR